MSRLTDNGEPNHLSMGARSHRTDCTETHTYIHVLSYGEPEKIVAIPEVFALLWEKTRELSDGC